MVGDEEHRSLAHDELILLPHSFRDNRPASIEGRVGEMEVSGYIVPFESVGLADLESVGGKNASLGELIANLAAAGVDVPGGFAITAAAYRDFLAGGLGDRIHEVLDPLEGTPECRPEQNTGGPDLDLEDCADHGADNLLFWQAGEGTTLTFDQIAVLRSAVVLQ